MKPGSGTMIVALTLGVVSLTGCVTRSDPRQVYWMNNQTFVSAAIYQFGTKNVNSFTEGQLLAVLGKPDFRGAPTEFASILSGDDSCRESIMGRLSLQYSRWTARWRKETQMDRPTSEQGLAEFGTCQILLYDESEHFPKPMSCLGFSAVAYLVERSMVIATVPFAQWKGIIKTDRP